MMQFRLFVILLLLFCDVYALKSKRFRSRKLKRENVVGKKEGEEKEAKKEGDKSAKKEGDKSAKKEGDKSGKKGGYKSTKKEGDKSGKKSAKKAGKKTTKGKKCKKSSNINDTEDDEKFQRLQESEDIEDENLAECLAYGLDANCAALFAGREPSVPENADAVVGGTIRMEITAKDKNAIERMNKALTVAALNAVGCNISSSERMLQSGGTKTEAMVSFNGMTVDGLSKISDDCLISGVEENCTLLESSITLFYSGNATAEHLNSMAYSISDAVIEKSEKGDYDDFASVHYVEAAIGEFSTQLKSQSNMGGIVGSVLAMLALAAAGGAGYMYYKNLKGKPVKFSNPLSRQGDPFKFTNPLSRQGAPFKFTNPFSRQGAPFKVNNIFSRQGSPIIPFTNPFTKGDTTKASPRIATAMTPVVIPAVTVKASPNDRSTYPVSTVKQGDGEGFLPTIRANIFG